MHTWYQAVCDQCKERCIVMVTSTFHIRSEYVKDKEPLVLKFLSKHYGHDLRLIHRDEELDDVNEYTNAYRSL